MLVWLIAAKAPSSIDRTEVTITICCHSPTMVPKGWISTRTRSATAAILGAIEKNAVTGVGAPWYTSGAHIWKGAAEILNARAAATNTRPKIKPSGGSAAWSATMAANGWNDVVPAKP